LSRLVLTRITRVAPLRAMKPLIDREIRDVIRASARLNGRTIAGEVNFTLRRSYKLPPRKLRVPSTTKK